MPTLYVRNVPKAHTKRYASEREPIIARLLRSSSRYFEITFSQKKNCVLARRCCGRTATCPRRKKASKLAFRSSEELVRDSKER